MPPTQRLETLYEAAVRTALENYSEIDGIYPVRVKDDVTVSEIRPVILVQMVSTEDATSGSYDGYDVARVEIECLTNKNDDLDASVVNTMIGAVRDAWTQPSIESELEAAGGLKIFGTMNEGETFRSDEGDTRMRMIPVTVTGSSIVDVP